jgi:hypothetical protein
MHGVPAVLLLSVWSLLACMLAPSPALGQSACSRLHDLTVLDLTMVPPPVREGQPIRIWRLTLQSHHRGVCRLLLEIWDQEHVAGVGILQISPGRRVYTLQAVPGYRLRHDTSCFVVQATLAGSRTPLQAQQTLCVPKLAIIPVTPVRKYSDWGLQSPGVVSAPPAHAVRAISPLLRGANPLDNHR